MAQQAMHVEVPPGTFSGQKMKVQTPNGMMDVVVPQGVGPGDKVLIHVPAADGTAADSTAQLMRLMPADLQRPDVSTKDFAGFETRADCRELLKEITRAVPIKLLLERGPKSLHWADGKEKLTAKHFFMSKPVSQLQGFLSHRWNADPLESAEAIMLHFKMRFFLAAIVAGWGIICLMLLVMPPIVPLIVISCIFVADTALCTRNTAVLKLLGCATPAYWFDKATVHQTEHCLTQAGLYLFGYYLKLSRQLVILFKPVYLERVWCVYELAYWLKHKGKKGIVFIPLQTNATTIRFLVRCWPIMATFGAVMFGFSLGLGSACSRMVSDHKSDARKGMLYVFLAFLGVAMLAFTGFGLHFVVGNARAERRQVARKLQLFDVNKTQSFNPSDKDFVLDEIRKWWDTPGKDALDEFNRFVQTEVAARLDLLQWRREMELACVFLLLFLPIFAPFILLFEIHSRNIKPLAWPSIVDDSEGWVTPDDCYCANVPNPYQYPNISKTCTDYAMSRGSGDQGSDKTCFMIWDFGASALMSFIFLLLFICTIASCCCSLRSAKRNTATPSYRLFGAERVYAE